MTWWACSTSIVPDNQLFRLGMRVRFSWLCLTVMRDCFRLRSISLGCETELARLWLICVCRGQCACWAPFFAMWGEWAGLGAELTSRVPAIERWASLVRAALEIELEEGVAAVNTRSVCARANAPWGVFHYCFSGKGELLDLLYGDTATMLLGKFEHQNVDTVSDFPRTVLKLLVEKWPHVYILNEFAIFSSRVAPSGDKGMAGLRYLEAFIEGTEVQLDRRAERGGFRWAPNAPCPRALSSTPCSASLRRESSVRNSIPGPMGSGRP